MLNIEIVYGTAELQKLYRLQVPAPCTVKEAVALIPITQDFPDADLENMVMGIFGKVVKGDTLLKEGERIEIYRPLLADPKEARRKRVTQLKEQKP